MNDVSILLCKVCKSCINFHEMLAANRAFYYNRTIPNHVVFAVKIAQ